jgi:lycopene cyclase domain-containing protein
MKLLYLLIDILTLSVPLIFSFHPKISFYKTWKSVFKAVACISVPFLIFDSIFIFHDVWSFNPRYTTGISLFNLPLEEIMFFICIPYSCLFTYYCLNRFYNLSWNFKAENIFCISFSTILLVTGVIFWKKIYTSSTFISTAILCIFLKFVLNINWFGKAISVYAILIIPFLLVNGVLTGTGLSAPIVSYNPSYNLGIRIMTIPVEDFIYGFELFVLNLSLFLKFNYRHLSSLSYTNSIGTKPDSINNNGKYNVV